MEFSLFVLKTIGEIQNTAVTEYIGPAFILVLAVAAIIAFWKRQIREMFFLLAIAAIAAVLIYFGDALFGRDGSITNTTKDLVNTIILYELPLSDTVPFLPLI